MHDGNPHLSAIDHLATGGAARPSPDLTAAVERHPRRRRRIATAVLALTLVAAGSAHGATTTDPDGDAPVAATRTVETSMGPVEIPADPQRIVALDEYAAMNLLAVGIEPAVVLGSFGSQINQRVLTGLDIEVIEGSSQSVNFEAVAAAEPDLVVSSDEPAFLDSYDRLSEIAPTVVLPFNQPWRDMIHGTAAVFDRSDEGERLVGLLEARIDQMAAEVHADPRSISVLGDIGDTLFPISNQAAMSELIAEVGFTRPLAQAEGTPMAGFEFIIALSSEVVGEHDGDLVVVLSGSDYNAEAVTSLPTFQALPAVIDGRSFEVDGSMWFGTFPFATYWILEDLAALSAGDGQAGLGTIDDASDRWSDFQAMIG